MAHPIMSPEPIDRYTADQHDSDVEYDEGPPSIEREIEWFVNDDNRWQKWAEWQPCYDGARAWQTIDSRYETVMDGVKFPSCVRDQDVIDAFSRPEYCGFAKSVGHICETTADDPCKLKIYYVLLSQTWRSHISRMLYPCEADVRVAAEHIISYAFTMQGDIRHSYSRKARLVLPRRDGSSPPIAVADVIVTTTLAKTNFPDIKRDFVFSWSDSDVPWRHDPISFILSSGSVAKSRETVYSQLVTYFTTGLKHRRALGMTDSPLYGATLLSDRFTLHVAVWKDNKIVVHPTGHFWLFSRAIEFVDCYLHLCTLAQLIARQLGECLELPQEDIETARRRAITDPWRPGEEKSEDTNEVIEMDEEMDEEISEETGREMDGDDLSIASLTLSSLS